MLCGACGANVLVLVVNHRPRGDLVDGGSEKARLAATPPFGEMSSVIALEGKTMLTILKLAVSARRFAKDNSGAVTVDLSLIHI